MKNLFLLAGALLVAGCHFDPDKEIATQQREPTSPDMVQSRAVADKDIMARLRKAQAKNPRIHFQMQDHDVGSVNVWTNVLAKGKNGYGDPAGDCVFFYVETRDGNSDIEGHAGTDNNAPIDAEGSWQMKKFVREQIVQAAATRGFKPRASNSPTCVP